MTKVIKLTESKLNKIVEKILKEQEDQYMSDNNQENMSGDAQETSEPDFSQFIECAETLLSQGITVGQMVDKICEIKNTETDQQ